MGGKSSKKLVVRDSGGAYGEANKKAIYEPFTKETGIQIDVVNIQYAQMLAQIQQGRPQFEVIDDSMADFLRFQKADATEALDYDRLKNFKKAGIAKSLVTSNAVGKNYWASVMAFRTDVWGGKKPSSWADFWDTKAFPGDRALQALDADLPELEFALLADGVPMDKLYPLDVDRAFKSLSDIKGSVRKFWDTGALPGVLLGRKEVDASSVWHGRLDALIKGGSPLAYQWKGAQPAEQRLRHPQGGRQPRRRLQAHRLRTAARGTGPVRRALPDGPVGARRLQEALLGHRLEHEQFPRAPEDRLRPGCGVVAQAPGRRGQALAGVDA